MSTIERRPRLEIMFQFDHFSLHLSPNIARVKDKVLILSSGFENQRGKFTVIRIQKKRNLPSHSNLSSSKPEHTSGGTGRRTAAEQARGSGRFRPKRVTTGRRKRRIGALERQPFIFSPESQKTSILDVSYEARINEILCKPNRKMQRAVDKRFHTEITTASCSRPLANRPTIFVLVNPF